MAKTESNKDATGAVTSSSTSPATAKKKTTPKPRKRKASETGIVMKSGTTTVKKVATNDDSNDKDATVGVAAAEVHATLVPANKPFVAGELVESIIHMMFGCGDESEPLTESAELMEDFVVEYVQCMTKKAVEMSVVKGKLDPDCFIFLIRKDPDRYERINELLRANDEFRAVLNSGFDPSDEKMY